MSLKISREPRRLSPGRRFFFEAAVFFALKSGQAGSLIRRIGQGCGAKLVAAPFGELGPLGLIFYRGGVILN